MTILSEKNIDPNEIAKFNQLAQEWWDPHGPMKPLHQLNPLRLKYIQDITPLTTKRILDVGCGGGLLSEAMAQAGGQVTGIDISENLLQIAKLHAKQKNLNINYQQTAVEELSNENKFDVITCMELLEHVPNPESIIKTCADLLNPDGLIFFSTINRNLKAYLSAIIAAEYILQMLPKGTHQYSKLIKPSEIKHWASKSNLKLGGLRGISYRPFSGDFYLSSDVSVNYMIYFKKI